MPDDSSGFRRRLRSVLNVRERLRRRPPLLRSADVDVIALQLPAEVLAYIFALLDFDNRLTATHICQKWRASSLAFPADLWSSVRTIGLHRDAFRAQLERSQGVPLTVAIFCFSKGRGFFKTSLDDLLTHMRHVRHLAIRLDFQQGSKRRDPFKGYGAALVDFLRAANAPILQTLVLDIGSRRYGDDITLPQDLFRRSAPLLRTVVLRGTILLPPTCPAVVDVKHLSLSLKTEKDVEVLERLCSFAHLQDLCIDSSHAGWDTSIWRVPAEPVLLLRSLHYVGPIFSSVGDIIATYSSLRLANFLCMSYYEGVFAQTLPPHGEGCAQMAVYRLASGIPGFDIRVQQDDGRYVSITGVPQHGFLAGDLFTHVQDLTLAEAWLLDQQTELVLPNVRRLTVILMHLHDVCHLFVADGGYARGAGLFSGAREARFAICPRLETLVIAAGERLLQRWAISPLELLLFVQCGLAFGTPTIPRLVLRGVELLAHLPAMHAQLMDMVDEVHIEDPLPAHHLEDAARHDALWSLDGLFEIGFWSRC